MQAVKKLPPPKRHQNRSVCYQRCLNNPQCHKACSPGRIDKPCCADSVHDSHSDHILRPASSQSPLQHLLCSTRQGKPEQQHPHQRSPLPCKTPALYGWPTTQRIQCSPHPVRRYCSPAHTELWCIPHNTPCLLLLELLLDSASIMTAAWHAMAP